MYATIAVSIVDDILKSDESVIFELLGVTGSEGSDVVETVLNDFQKYNFVDILTLAIEAGLVWQTKVSPQ